MNQPYNIFFSSINTVLRRSLNPDPFACGAESDMQNPENPQKMNKKIIIIGSFLMIVIAIGTYQFRNYLPPRTPYKIARIHTDLTILDSYKLITFNENYSLSGEGVIYIVFKLNNREFDNLVRDCQFKNYTDLTTNNLIKDGFLDPNPEFGIRLYDRSIRDIGEGYYKLEAKDLKSMDFNLTILDIVKKELIIYVCFP